MPHGCEWKCSSECKKVACTTGRISSLLFTAGFTYCSVIQLCPTLCDPMDFSMPGFPVLHYLLEFAQTHVHWVSDAIQPSHPVILFSSCLQSFPASRSFPMSPIFASGGQRIGASASASVLPMNIQSWFPLRLTGLISLLSKGLSRVFTAVRKHQFLDMGLITAFLMIFLVIVMTMEGKIKVRL